MNIQEAKTEIKRTLKAYTAADDDGILSIPVTQQRPILLIGPPGIGKTAVMAQIAREESVGLVSYTMTPPYPPERHRAAHSEREDLPRPNLHGDGIHHERNRGLRLRLYGNHRLLRRHPLIDEINCVSETLARSCCSCCKIKPSAAIASPRAG